MVRRLGRFGMVTGDYSSEIGFQRSRMEKFYYILFDAPITDSLKANYNDGCKYKWINNQVAISWYGGTIGPECLEGYEGIRK
ncbi:MAG TPA: hypothetical protein VFG10_03520 [Saprospiraceae bacterium]|nr:hypothetical protein [Saprospiraceae bacterium]